MKLVVTSLALLLAARAAYAQSELRFASHVEIRAEDATASGAAPTGSVADSVTVISDHGTRTESHQSVPTGFKLTVEIPGPTGTPAIVETTGDVWVTDEFSAYTNKMMGRDLAGAAMLGAGGFPLHTIVRGGIVGPNEVDVTVMSVAEEPFQPELFDPPPDYKERTITGAVR